MSHRRSSWDCNAGLELPTDIFLVHTKTDIDDKKSAVEKGATQISLKDWKPTDSTVFEYPIFR